MKRFEERARWADLTALHVVKANSMSVRTVNIPLQKNKIFRIETMFTIHVGRAVFWSRGVIGVILL